MMVFFPGFGYKYTESSASANAENAPNPPARQIAMQFYLVLTKFVESLLMSLTKSDNAISGFMPIKYAHGLAIGIDGNQFLFLVLHDSR